MALKEAAVEEMLAGADVFPWDNYSYTKSPVFKPNPTIPTCAVDVGKNCTDSVRELRQLQFEQIGIDAMRLAVSMSQQRIALRGDLMTKDALDTWSMYLDKIDVEDVTSDISRVPVDQDGLQNVQKQLSNFTNVMSRVTSKQ